MTSVTKSTRMPATARHLAIAGMLPFAFAASTQWLTAPWIEPARGVFLGLAYGAVVLSFLGGIRWGTAIGPRGTRRQALEFIGSVLPALAAWLALLLPPILGLSLLIASFLMQALWDVTSVDRGRLPQWFGKFRMILTAGAIISLIIMLVPQTI